MSLLQFQPPTPPRIHDPALFVTGILIGLAVLVSATFVIDKLGTAMFKRGFAKPFYVKGRRIHHNFIYAFVPAAYGLILALYFLGYVKIIWHSMWLNLAYTVVLVLAALAVDFLGDRYWPRIRRDVILHHEWIYGIVPAYIFLFVLNIVI